jgi:hypothetical protein
LVLRRRPLEVRRHQEGPLALAAHEARQLSRGRRFAGPLEADQHDHGWRLTGRA